MFLLTPAVIKYGNRELNYNECNSKTSCENFLRAIIMLRSVASEKRKAPTAFLCLRPLPSDPLRRVASSPEDVLGSGGWLLHGGLDSHLHVPVQKCVWAVQTDHGHVRGRVSFCVCTNWPKFVNLFLGLRLRQENSLCLI